jgi:hypothetical protein
MYADAALAAILQADSVETHPGEFPPPPDTEPEHFKVQTQARWYPLASLSIRASLEKNLKVRATSSP